MLILVGEDRPGIVARVTRAIYETGCSLGEASMIRLGGNFTIMMMVSGDAAPRDLELALAPVAKRSSSYACISTRRTAACTGTWCPTCRCG